MDDLVEWLDLLVHNRWIMPIAVLVVVVVLVTRTATKAWPFMRRLVLFLNALIGDEKHPGLLERVAFLERSAAVTTHQVTNNSGTSLKDSVDRTEALIRDLSIRQDMTQEQVSRINEKLGNDDDRLTEIEDTITKPDHK